MNFHGNIFVIVRYERESERVSEKILEPRVILYHVDLDMCLYWIRTF